MDGIVKSKLCKKENIREIVPPVVNIIWTKIETQRLGFASFNQNLFKIAILGGLLDILRQ
ncbi:hypothetical protein H5410_002520 [Solanum commersonii]|uniref:Uncharacterized protein n=1 Tax=Solanum commersonii TaxID=4109 RepID=A0A9J6B2H8_SOLCO|nr:hypothetical protein H5410_002520 [Solanum commersonii]